MATHNLPPNTDKSKKDIDKRLKERRDIERRPVSKSEIAKKKDKGMLESFVDKIIVNDVAETKDFLVKEVIEPRIRMGILDVIIEGSRYLLGGDSRGYDRNRSSIDNRTYRGTYSGISTNNSSINVSRDDRSRDFGGSRPFDSRDYPLPSRGKAEEVLARLREDIYEYDRATVAAFLKEVGCNPSYTDMDIGWLELDEGSCYVRGTIDGYIVVLPKPGKV